MGCVCVHVCVISKKLQISLYYSDQNEWFLIFLKWPLTNMVFSKPRYRLQPEVKAWTRSFSRAPLVWLLYCSSSCVWCSAGSWINKPPTPLWLKVGEDLTWKASTSKACYWSRQSTLGFHASDSAALSSDLMSWGHKWGLKQKWARSSFSATSLACLNTWHIFV